MQSFFGNSKPSSKPGVSTVTVKKVVHRPSPVAKPSSSSSIPKRPLSTSYDRKPSSSSSSKSAFSKSSPAQASLSKAKTASPAPRKRRQSPQRVLPPSDSESDSDDALAPKRRRVGLSASTPDIGTGDLPVNRKLFCPSLVDARGEWGRGWAGFVECEEALRGRVSGWAGGDKETKDHREKYQAYFPQPGFENVEPLPSVELLYPSGCIEKFILLTPTSQREYNPVSELRNALRLILKHYIPPTHTHIFGSLESSGEFESTVPSRLHTPTPGASPAGEGSPMPPSTAHETIGDSLRRALAPNRRDGPGLLKAVKRFNSALAEIRHDGTLAAYLSSNEYRITRREWSELVDFIHDQAYSRVVGPFSDQLEHHPKHPDEVAAAIHEKEDAYGELRHNFMSKVIEQTELGPNSVFVDLGSGVGNCVVQAALQAGCTSSGFELLPVPSRCARMQLAECKRRWAMWALEGNMDAVTYEGDFTRHPEVSKQLSKADVVLVNNEVFPSSLNIKLTHSFLDLKDGAKIISLKPFVPEGFRMNEMNCDSFASILKSEVFSYYSGWVSWKADSGKYYVQTVDRSLRLKYEEQQNGRKRRN